MFCKLGVCKFENSTLYQIAISQSPTLTLTTVNHVIGQLKTWKRRPIPVMLGMQMDWLTLSQAPKSYASAYWLTGWRTAVSTACKTPTQCSEGASMWYTLGIGHEPTPEGSYNCWGHAQKHFRQCKPPLLNTYWWKCWPHWNLKVESKNHNKF